MTISSPYPLPRIATFRRALAMAAVAAVIAAATAAAPVAFGRPGAYARTVKLILPRVAHGTSDMTWAYFENYGVSEVRFEAGVRVPGNAALLQLQVAVADAKGVWHADGSPASQLAFDLDAVGSVGVIEARTSVRYRGGVVHVNSGWPLVAGEHLVSWPFPDQLSVFTFDLSELTWRKENDASPLERVEISATSGPSNFRDVVQYRKLGSEVFKPGSVTAIFEWQRGVALPPVVATVTFYLVDGTKVEWKRNGLNLRTINDDVMLTNEDLK